MAFLRTAGTTRCTRCGVVINTDGTWRPLATHDETACDRPGPPWLIEARNNQRTTNRKALS